MYNASREFNELLYSRNNKKYYGKADVLLYNNTTLSVPNSDIWQGGVGIVEQTSGSSGFSIGRSCCSQLIFKINNLTEKYSDYDFYDAEIVPYEGLQLSQTIEYIKKGVFTVDEPKQVGGYIQLTCMDNMHKLEGKITSLNGVTAGEIVSDICIKSGVMLKHSNFGGYDVSLDLPDNLSDYTYRQMLEFVCACTGNFARCDENGLIDIKWYDFELFEEALFDGGYFDETTELSYQSGDSIDGGNFADYSSGDNADGGSFDIFSRHHHFYSLKNKEISTDDVIITGVKFTYQEETYQFGTDGYVLEITDNPLSVGKCQQIATYVGQKIAGMRFRPMNIETTYNPLVQAGDVGFVTDRKQNTYRFIITSLSATIGQGLNLSNAAETPQRNRSQSTSAETRAIIASRREAEKKIAAYDVFVRQLNNLVTHSFGVYKTDETLSNGSVIYYMHDKPTLAESMKIWKQTADAFAVSTDGGVTYTAGFDINGNAVVNVLAAIGINADWIRLGKLLSNDGATLIDMQYGVANSDNFSFIDNIQNGFPLTMPFNIDDSVSRINKVLLKFTQQNFRTYSTNASSGGGAGATSQSGGGVSLYVQANGSAQINTYSYEGSTLNGHLHQVDLINHAHAVDIPSHTHTFSIGSHTHTLNFGIQEQAISNNEITVYVDGTLRATTSDLQGIIDLTAFVTTPGWHNIEVQSATLKRISAQINIKSYIRS